MRDERTFWYCLRTSDECWLWTRSRNATGYGSVNWFGRSTSTHRLAWLLVYGEFTPGLRICHRCDVRECCNPAHLYEGTAGDNTADMVRRGRAGNGRARGSRNGNARLTEELAQGIRLGYRGGAKPADLVLVYGISKTQIYRIVRGESWGEEP